MRKFLNWIFGNKVIATENYRNEKNKTYFVKNTEISEGYVLLDYSDNPLCICVCTNGDWVTITQYDPLFDKELCELLKDKYTTRRLKWLVEIQNKFESDLLTRKEMLKKSKASRI